MQMKWHAYNYKDIVVFMSDPAQPLFFDIRFYAQLNGFKVSCSWHGQEINLSDYAMHKTYAMAMSFAEQFAHGFMLGVSCQAPLARAT